MFGCVPKIDNKDGLLSVESTKRFICCVSYKGGNGLPLEWEYNVDGVKTPDV